MARSIHSLDSYLADSLISNDPISSTHSLLFLTPQLYTKDDSSICNYSTYTNQADYYLSAMTPWKIFLEPNDNCDDWEPMVALRHTAQQIMIKNLTTDFLHKPNSSVSLDTLKPSNMSSDYRSSLMSSFSIPSSDFSSNSDSTASIQPISPTASEFFNDIFDSIQPPSIKGKGDPYFSISRERSLSQGGETNLPFNLDSHSIIAMKPSHNESIHRQRSASVVSYESVAPYTGTDIQPKFNSKTAVRSTIKAAKLLGIEQMARQHSEGDVKPVLSQPMSSNRSISMGNTPSYPSLSISSSRASAAAKNLKSLVNNKLTSLRRNSSKGSMPTPDDVSIKSVTKANSALIQGWAELYKGVSAGFKPKPKWKKLYFVLNHDQLFMFEDSHPTTVTQHYIKLTPATIICVSDSIQSCKWVLEIADSYNTFYIKLNGKLELSNWLKKLKEASNLAKFNQRSLPSIPPQLTLNNESISEAIQKSLSISSLGIDDSEFIASTSVNDTNQRSLDVSSSSYRDDDAKVKSAFEIGLSKQRPYRLSPTFLAYPSLAEVPEC